MLHRGYPRITTEMPETNRTPNVAYRLEQRSNGIKKRVSVQNLRFCFFCNFFLVFHGFVYRPRDLYSWNEGLLWIYGKCAKCFKNPFFFFFNFSAKGFLVECVFFLFFICKIKINLKVLCRLIDSFVCLFYFSVDYSVYGQIGSEKVSSPENGKRNPKDLHETRIYIFFFISSGKGKPKHVEKGVGFLNAQRRFSFFFSFFHFIPLSRTHPVPFAIKTVISGKESVIFFFFIPRIFFVIWFIIEATVNKLIESVALNVNHAVRLLD